MTQHVARIVVAFVLIALPAIDSIRAAEMSQLQDLRNERKFVPTEMYTGPDTPEDGPQLIALVNGAIDDVISMPRPLVADRVRSRLQKLIDDVDQFATEDREQAHVYVIRIWRASGFKEESRLFPRRDDWMPPRPIN
jgi:hypothetical protein